MNLTRTLLVATFVAISALAAATPGAKAAPEIFTCPTSVQSDVRHPGDSNWIATNQSSAVDTLQIQTIAGNRSMVCVYWLFGTRYWAHRPFPARAVCEPNLAERRFYCYD